MAGVKISVKNKKTGKTVKNTTDRVSTSGGTLWQRERDFSDPSDKSPAGAERADKFIDVTEKAEKKRAAEKKKADAKFFKHTTKGK